jgi:arsenate reductase-like glutaredoxin family protein
LRYATSRFRRKNLLPSKNAGPLVRRVTVYADLGDPFCGEIIRLLEGAGLDLHIHDVSKEPLSYLQVSDLVKHYDLDRFLDSSSKPYKRNKLAESAISREDVLKIIADDNTILRMPIVVSGGKISVGFDPRQIMEMLQIRQFSPSAADA